MAGGYMGKLLFVDLSTGKIEEEAWWHLGAFDWDRKTTVPSRQKLLSLGLGRYRRGTLAPGKNAPDRTGRGALIMRKDK